MASLHRAVPTGKTIEAVPLDAAVIDGGIAAGLDVARQDFKAVAEDVAGEKELRLATP